MPIIPQVTVSMVIVVPVPVQETFNVPIAQLQQLIVQTVIHKLGYNQTVTVPVPITAHKIQTKLMLVIVPVLVRVPLVPVLVQTKD